MWKPQPSDIEWTRNFLARLNDGGTWGIPANRSVWKHDKTHRVLRCIHGERDEDFNRVTTVCTLIGYTTEYAPEAMTPAQVQEHISMSADVFGSGKTHVVTDQSVPGGKKYLWRPVTEQDLATYRVNLAKLPKRMRWQGKATPQCDFCSHDKPVATYAADRLTTGEIQRCWRWLACRTCHDAITRNDFKAVERRASTAFGYEMDARTAGFAVKMALTSFHSYAIEA